MAKLPDENLYTLTNFPCTHDSSAFHMNKIGSCYSKTQNLDYNGQLKIGVRHFDIRVTKRSCSCFLNCSKRKEEQKCEDIITCHGICDCYYYSDCCSTKKLTLKEVLLTLRKFLEKNPSEGVFINLQNGRGDKHVNMPRALEIFDIICGDISMQMDKKLKIKDIRGKIICSPHLDDDDYKKIKPAIKPAKLYRKLKGGYGLEEIHQNYGKYSTFKVGGRLKVKEVKEFLDKYEMPIDKAKAHEQKNNNNFPINYSVSCTGEHDSILPYPKTQAVFVNNFFRQRAFKKGFYYGWINFDFITEDIARKIISTNILTEELEESTMTTGFFDI